MKVYLQSSETEVELDVVEPDPKDGTFVVPGPIVVPEGSWIRIAGDE